MKKQLLTLLFAISTIISFSQVPNYVPSNGLVGYWPFNGNANDESGNGNNGTVNGATLTADRNGLANKAYSFGGIQNILVQHNNSFNMGSNYSVSIWFTVNDFNNVRTLINKNSIGEGKLDYFNIGILPSTGTLYTQFGDGNLIDNIISPNIPNLNVWYNAIFTVNDSVKLFVNGQLIEKHLRTIPPLQNTENLSFGYWQNQNHTYHNGKIDDIGIWNRALTRQEISNLYNGCQLSVNSQPSNQSINIDNSSQFKVGSSDPNASYQWQTDLGVGFQNLNSVGQYNGTTNDTLTISNVTMSNNNQPFRCIVSSGSCSDTSNIAVLTVNNNIGLNEISQDNLFSVYPNPAKSLINVKADSKLIGEVYKIYDNSGRVVFSGKLDSQNSTIELGNLSGGIYMFSVGENMKQAFKVIKE